MIFMPKKVIFYSYECKTFHQITKFIDMAAAFIPSTDNTIQSGQNTQGSNDVAIGQVRPYNIMNESKFNNSVGYKKEETISHDDKIPIKRSLYVEPKTMRQISQLYTYNKEDLLDLINKVFFGYKVDNSMLLDKIINANLHLDDNTIYNILRKYGRKNPVNRGLSRSKDIKQLIHDYPTTYLDFGGGDGLISYHIAKTFNIRAKNAFSADIDNWNKREHNHKYDITYIVLKDKEKIPLPDNSIDLITCFQVFHHIENIDFVLSELRRICRGKIVLREHDCDCDITRMLIDVEHSLFEMCIEDNKDDKYLNNYKAWYRSKEEWIKLLSIYGFKETYTREKIIGTTRYYYSVFSV